MRFKKFRKTLHFYKVNYGLAAPWHVIGARRHPLLDESFIDHVIANNSEAFRLLGKVLGGESRACLTACTHAALKARGAYATFLNDLTVLPCSHSPALPVATCIDTYLATLARRALPLPPNAERVAYACQDAARRRAVGSTHAGVPLLFMSNKVVLMLEPPTPASLAGVKAREQRRAGVSDAELGVVQAAQAAAIAESSALRTGQTATVSSALSHLSRQRPMKKAKGPNPLSVKKKKPKAPPQPSPKDDSAEVKRKRKRKRGKKTPSVGEAKPAESKSMQGGSSEEESEDERPAKRQRMETASNSD